MTIKKLQYHNKMWLNFIVYIILH